VEEIGKKIEMLANYLFSEVNDFVGFLLIKYEDIDINTTKFKFDWKRQINPFPPCPHTGSFY
jgi:hypothetical protein